MISVSDMTKDDFKMAMEWAVEENWNIGKFDICAYFAQEEHKFLLIKEGCQEVGVVCAIKYSSNFSFLGLFIVAPSFRGQGYGRRILKELLFSLKKCCSINLYSVLSQVDMYHRYGFSPLYKNLRCEFPKQRDDIADFESIMNKQGFSYNTIEDSDTSDFNDLAEQDFKYWGQPRSTLLKHFLQQPSSSAVIIRNEFTDDVCGYGIVRECVDGFRLGPVYSESIDGAKLIVSILVGSIPDKSEIFLDTPAKNKLHLEFIDYFNLTRNQVFDTCKMVKGIPHSNCDEKCYGIASLDFG